MAAKLNVSFDSDMLESISSEFDLRAPNKEALRQLVFTLDGDYDPAEMQVLNLATGVGKTYLMAAFVEYLRRQGVGNVVIVTPGKTVQSKTVQNFTPGEPRYITGSAVPPEVVTPQDYSAWIARQNGSVQLAFGREIPMLAFIFNIQQLIAPKDAEGDTHGATQDAMRRKPRRFDENAGVLFDYLKGLDDLVVIADESHLYGASATAFNAALKELDPAAAIGLTASVNKKTDHVIFEYPLYRAIQDKYVKAPVLAFRKTGYGTDEVSEEQQLRDALQLRALKQAYYDSYAASQNRDHVNAVAFVVCSDVEHATQVAELLRTPEYLGRDDAVLQVDSKHEDELTQRRLDELDRPESPVLAVVSVNKLKEGWDVKNIAVVVTLRAMASEVLTQQTMGRGLRLPFGKYTGVWQIDQLDIISHQSFKELLEAEDVLRQFGLEDAASSADKAQVEEAIKHAAPNEVTGVGGTGTPGVAGGSGIQPGVVPGAPTVGVGGEGAPVGWSGNGFNEGAVASQGGTLPSSTVGVRAIDDTDFGGDDIEFVTIARTKKLADVTYTFPVTRVQVNQPKMQLFEIDDRALETAAKRVTSTADVLHRKEIIAALGKGLSGRDAESAEVDSIHVSEEEARKALVKLVINMHLVPKTEPNARYAEKQLVPKFMGSVPFDTWSVKALDSARTELFKVVEAHAVEVLRGTQEVATLHPKPLPGDEFSLPLGEKIYDQIDDGRAFVRGRFYGGWTKSLFEAESFDSFSGEYELARLLNRDPHIVWWHRLHRSDDAYLYYTSKDRYFPDFVAFDDTGVLWIIEGKDTRGREDATVQAKRKAAETLVRRLTTEDGFDDQDWGYLVAYEDDIKKADSWEDLKTLANPVSSKVG
ncbi:restriction endonuclease [Dermabacter jinjuensis]|uniref:Restriction endonuclease n=2 Tax=Dermabacter jinjuensis TaxID=1667168 RepID=A0ABM6PJT5_9MICO|nr:DEAD/DEAH box helicase family protein [Dermabacter jinjuensis]ATH96061.1 restriction endonuclease [Dermabacter jinjuensis]